MHDIPIETQLQAFDSAALTGFVRQSLHSETLEVDNWHAQSLHNATGIATGGVYRVAGIGQEQEQQREWSLILKVIRLTPTGRIAGEDMAHALYWKREALAYESGLLADLPEGLRVPRCFGVVERDDETLWLWLEDVRDGYGWQWSLEQYARTARHLGYFNGVYLTSRPLPMYPWLTGDGSPRGVLDAYVGLREVVQNQNVWRHPLLHSAFPVPVTDRLVRLWDDRGRLLDVFERLPQTLCHLDAWRGNLFAPGGEDGRERIVLLDWAYIGRGAIGTDAGDLAGASYGMLGVEECEPRVFSDEVFENYLHGLREAGWQGDQRTVRFAFATMAALKYGCLLPWLRDISVESRYGWWERRVGQSMSEFVHNAARWVYYLLDLADEARELADEI